MTCASSRPRARHNGESTLSLALLTTASQARHAPRVAGPACPAAASRPRDCVAVQSVLAGGSREQPIAPVQLLADKSFAHFLVSFFFCVFCVFLRLFHLRDEDQPMGIESDVSRRDMSSHIPRIREGRTKLHLGAPGAPNRRVRLTAGRTRSKDHRSESGFVRPP